MLLTALRVLARCWPALLAWFLAGWTAKALLTRLAGFLGNDDGLVGHLVLALAILTQLLGYVGMFLAVRGELRHLGAVDDAERGEVSPRPLRQWAETLLAAVLPFFVLYVAWRLVYDDYVAYGDAALGQGDVTSTRFLDLPVDAASITVVAVAFGGRFLLGRFAGRLPRWTAGISAYLEAVWVLVVLLILQELLAGVPQWFASRRMFAWAVDAWASFRDGLGWFEPVLDGIGWAIGQIGTVMGLPLAWLAVASIVYFGAMPRTATPSPARLRAVGERWNRMPVWLRAIAGWISAGFLDRWHPVGLAARLIWRAGPLAIGGYVLAFAVVTVGGTWLQVALYRALGPHDTGWWFGASDVVELVVGTVVAVLQIALVAAAFDTALRTDAAQRLVDDAGDAVSAAAAPAAAPDRT